MIYPSLEQFKENINNSKLATFAMEMEGDLHTPISIFKKMCKGKNTYMLESVEKGKWGKYSYIGRNPFMQIRAYAEKVEIERGGETEVKTGKPLDIIRNVIGEYAIKEDADSADFTGGAVGYVGYDFVRTCEKLGEPGEDDFKMPDVHLMVAKEMVAYDHERQKIKLMINIPIDDVAYENGHEKDNADSIYEYASERLASIRAEIENPEPIEKREEGVKKYLEYSSSETKESFMEKVLKAKEYIKDGDIFQVVLSQRLQVETDMHPFDVYRTLRTLNPSPYMYYIDYGDYHIAGSSPELLVKAVSGKLETCPIAGPRPRGVTSEEDDAHASELIQDEKERAEHMMLVDLARNDIGRISKFGTVKLTNFMEIQKYSHVMHIVSNVIGDMKEECDMFDSLRACLPAGTVSGAPKVRAMQIIDELEYKKRGVYAGAIGYFGFNGNMDTCIAIRTIVFKEGKAHIQAGAGIVADSDPLSEYNETLRKAQALVQAIDISRGDAK